MVALPFAREPAEEQEHIAKAHALPVEMGLRAAALAEHAALIGQEHRVVVAKVVV